MTYLDLINGVLRRLREDEVAAVDSTAYSAMIGDFVNDAKEVVEKAWDWTHLREIITVNTVASTNEYTWTGKGNPVEVIGAYNDTANTVLNYASQDYFDRRKYIQGTEEGSVSEFTFRKIDSNGNTVIEVWPTPNDVQVLRFNAKVEQPRLTALADKILVPWAPVLHLALAMAARERGETGGTSTAEYFSLADRYLSDAIASDAAYHPHETVFHASYIWPNNTLRL